MLGRPFSSSWGRETGQMTGLITESVYRQHVPHLQRAYLGQVSHQVQGNLGEGIVEVATDHVDPVGAVAGVAVRAVQAHHVSQVGERGRLLVGAQLGYLVSRLLAERSGAVKVLDEMW